MTAQLAPALRALLVCPSCRGELTDVPDGLLCKQERTLYPIVEGVPFLVPECSRPSTDAEWQAAQ